METTLYVMDDATFVHLSTWAEQWAPCAPEEVYDFRNRMIDFLQSLELEEAHHYLDHGWRHIADLVR